jgi:hypothetical protein
MTDPTPDNPDDELVRLRAEVARLEHELADTRPIAVAERPTEPPEHGRTGVWRPILATVLIALAALLAPLAIVATWAHDEISDTDRYVETIAPLASDPAVQDAVIQRITNEIFDRLDVKAVTQDAVNALADRGLPPRAVTTLGALATPLTNAIRSFVEEQVGRLVRSQEFEDAWVAANREAHTQMVAVLTGETSDAVQVSEGKVSVNLATVIETVKGRLVDRGFTLAERIPTVNAQFTILQSADLTKAQTAFRVLSALARTLPWLALILLGVGVFVARSRRRALVAGSLAVAAAMLLLGIALNAFRVVYLDAVPPDQLSPGAAAAVYDTLAHFIRLNLRAVLVLFLAVAAFAWVTGPGPTPTAVRRGGTSAIDVLRHGSDRAGLNTGRFGIAVDAYRTPLRAVVLGIALLVYVLAAHPTGAFTLIVLGCTLVALLVIELLARPPTPVSREE